MPTFTSGSGPLVMMISFQACDMFLYQSSGNLWSGLCSGWMTHNYLLVVSPFPSVGGNLTPTQWLEGFWFRVPSSVAFVYLALPPHRGRRDYRVHNNAEFQLVPSFECCELTVTLVFEFHFFRNFMNHFLFWLVANLNFSYVVDCTSHFLLVFLLRAKLGISCMSHKYLL